MITIIVAVAENLAIGKDNDLLWHISADLKRFKQLTAGHTVIMGRRTWESLPKRPLPGRRNIVITDVPGERFEGAETVASLEAAAALCDPSEENFIIGGASVYRQFLSLADRLCLTMVHKAFEGDVFFPEIDYSGWKLTAREEVPFDETLGFSYAYETWDRVR